MDFTDINLIISNALWNIYIIKFILNFDNDDARNHSCPGQLLLSVRKAKVTYARQVIQCSRTDNLVFKVTPRR